MSKDHGTGDTLPSAAKGARPDEAAKRYDAAIAADPTHAAAYFFRGRFSRHARKGGQAAHAIQRQCNVRLSRAAIACATFR